MNKLQYILNGFGFRDAKDYTGTILKVDSLNMKLTATLSALVITVANCTGLNIAVFAAFVALIIAEFQTGLKVSLKKGERFKSRKFGRMILKIGTYVMVITVLHTFASHIKTPSVLGFEINPFEWLYYTVFMAIVFQLFVSWMENLGCLGYKETRTIAGFVLRKFNKWFEFDGSKDNGTE